MIHRKIAGIERPVSALCLGTAQYGSQMDEAASFALLDRFAERGGTFLDSAHIYGAWAPAGANGGCGNSEVVIGRWMRARRCRRGMVVATKGGHPDFRTGASRLTREGVTRHLQESLVHLDTDYIDLYWLHRDDRAIPVAEILGWIEGPFRQGLIRAVGCSHWRTDRLREAMQCAAATGLPHIIGSQIAWSLAQAGVSRVDGPFGEQLAMDAETWAFHRDSGLAVAAYNAQAGGFFAARYDDLDFASPDFPKPGLWKKYGGATNLRRRRAARALARRNGCSANQVAVAYLLHQPFPTYALVGPRTLEQLDDSMGAADVALSAAEAAGLAADSDRDGAPR